MPNRRLVRPPPARPPRLPRQPRGRGRRHRAGQPRSRPRRGPTEPAGAEAAALRAEGEAGPAHLLLGGGQPPRHLGLQAGADQTARPADAEHREAHHLPGRERQPREEPLGVPPARPVGQDDLRPPAEARRVRRRPLLHPLAHVEDQHARPRRDVRQHGVHARRLPQRRLVGLVRARHRERRPARLRGDPRPSRRAAARPGQLGQRLPARRLPGHRLQRRPAHQPPATPRRDRRGAATAPRRISSAS